MERVFGSRTNNKVKQWKEDMIVFIESSVDDVNIESSTITLHAKADPHLKEMIEDSRKFLEGVSQYVTQQLRDKGEQGSFSLAPHKKTAFKLRGAFETLSGGLEANKKLNEKALVALKTNAELQAAAIIKKILEKSFNDMPGILDGAASKDLTPQVDWDTINLTLPKI